MRRKKRKSALDLVTGSNPAGRLDVLAFGVLDRTLEQLDMQLGLGGIGRGIMRAGVAEFVTEYVPDYPVFGESEQELDYEEFEDIPRTRKAATKKTRTSFRESQARETSRKKTRFRPKTQRSVFSARENEIIDAEFVDITE